jgi:photosystem II stability/assembly factor-like uncharacterized protein
MKKYIIILPFLFLLVFFSGCSFTGNLGSSQSDNNTTTKKTGNIWRSSDGGNTWEALLDAKIDISSVEVLSIAINPNDSNSAFFGLRGQGILKTTDGGKSWEYLKILAEKVYGLALNPQNPNILYASGVWQKKGKVWRSQDQGVNWDEIYTSPAEGPLVIALALDKNNPKNVYISTSDSQVLKSSDEGKSWSKVFSPKAAIARIAFSKNNPSSIYLLSENGDLSRSQNGGATFEDITKNIRDSLGANGQFGEIDVDPNGGVYLGGSEGLIRSKDAGTKWERIQIINDTATFPVRSLAANPQKANEIIYGSAQATYKSTDSGACWTTSQFDISKVVRILEYSAQNPSIIYLGVASVN